MVTTVFATKLGMTQAWTKAGKRVAVTRCQVEPNVVVGTQPAVQDHLIFEIGYGAKKLKNMSKPLRSRLEKGGFSFGVRQITGLRVAKPAEGEAAPLQVGQEIALNQVLSVGDVVQVQGVTKGRGFAGAMKRHGFHGGPKTHGQSDRGRAVGSIGAGTTPGRVLKGQRMPGHFGTETQTVKGLVVLHIDPSTKEVWLSGPVPGFATSRVVIEKTGETRPVELDLASAGLEPVSAPAAEVETEAQPEVPAEASQPTTEEVAA